MKVKWFPPFDRFFGKESEITMKEPHSLRSLLVRIREKEPRMEPYARFSPEDKQPHGLMVWRGGEVLTLDDTLRPDDEVEMIIMVSGG